MLYRMKLLFCMIFLLEELASLNLTQLFCHACLNSKKSLSSISETFYFKQLKQAAYVLF